MGKKLWYEELFHVFNYEIRVLNFSSDFFGRWHKNRFSFYNVGVIHVFPVRFAGKSIVTLLRISLALGVVKCCEKKLLFTLCIFASEILTDWCQNNSNNVY